MMIILWAVCCLLLLVFICQAVLITDKLEEVRRTLERVDRANDRRLNKPREL